MKPDDIDELIEKASRLVEHAAANLDFELWQPGAAQAAGFTKPAERVTVTCVSEHRPPEVCPER